ncbi:pre-mRNA-splicing factor 18 isoform X2 [Phyllostomus hastatus]|uniref:pre-mRNA-splicing factor 18 isoform X2 n=1 Tax=Phyllostomus hastatus TaxID=9423 RepID=UPI001E6846E3|nr:pre-mRNA-splicing factor 18 isoform X2 [Phyllostomus hastatus]
MDVLKSEILRKRQLVEDRNLLVENKKYFKRSELAKKEEEAYFERCGYKIQPKEEDQKPSTSSNPVLELELAEEKLPMTLSRQEVIRRLRERGEPIRLFGETDYDAFQRLRKIEILTPEVNKGLRNDLKAALDKIDQQYLNELVGGQEPGEEDTQNDLKVHEENTTIEELEALGESLGKGDDHKDMDIITKFLKFLLGVWAKELNAREDYVKRSVQGKLNSATQKQTESYLRPLFRKLRKRNLPADIKESITDIIKFMLQREYVKANDAYLQMAIGNAPWPIGVTMVGIHARTGREKIFSKHVAHVLNDETQRKYIQDVSPQVRETNKRAVGSEIQPWSREKELPGWRRRDALRWQQYTRRSGIQLAWIGTGRQRAPGRKKRGNRPSTSVFGHTESCLTVGERMVTSAWKSKKMGKHTCAKRGWRHNTVWFCLKSFCVDIIRD